MSRNCSICDGVVRDGDEWDSCVVCAKCFDIDVQLAKANARIDTLEDALAAARTTIAQQADDNQIANKRITELEQHITTLTGILREQGLQYHASSGVATPVEPQIREHE